MSIRRFRVIKEKTVGPITIKITGHVLMYELYMKIKNCKHETSLKGKYFEYFKVSKCSGTSLQSNLENHKIYPEI